MCPWALGPIGNSCVGDSRTTCLEYARASLIETQNHLDDALDCRYTTQKEHDELFKMADRAIGAVTDLHRYLRSQVKASVQKDS
jgi:hypothetical protein